MPRGFGGENEAGRANDPSGMSFGGGMGEGQSSVTADTFSGGGGGGGGGGGRQDGPGGALEEQSYVATGRMSGPGSGAYNAAIDAISRGMNPYATSTQNYIANQLGYREPTDIPGMLGYDTQKSFGQNIQNMVVPGRNTPLGVLSAAIPGSDTVKGIAGLANAIAGKMGLGSTTNPAVRNQGIASGSTVVGKDSIVGEYTGRPDDAPAFTDFTPSYPSGQNFGRRDAGSDAPGFFENVVGLGSRTLSDIFNPQPEVSVQDPRTGLGGTGVGRQDSTLDFAPSRPPPSPPTSQEAIDAIKNMIDQQRQSSVSMPQGGIAQTELGQFLQNRAPQNLGPAVDDQLAFTNVIGGLTGKLEQLTPTLARRGSIYTSNPIDTSRNRGSSGFDTTNLKEAAQNAIDFLKSLNPVGDK